MGAIRKAAEEHGYANTTLREVVALAGVSNTTFYEHFDSLDECFLATVDALVGEASQQIGRAYWSGSSPRERLHAALEKFVDIAVAEPATTSLVVIDTPSLGLSGVARRQRLSKTFEQMLHQSFEQTHEQGEVSDVTIRAIVGGFRRVLYRTVRSGELEKLRNHVDELLDWALSYGHPKEVSPSTALAAASGLVTPPGQAAAQADDAVGWDEPPDSPRSRSVLPQRERIIRAAAIVAGENGYSKLSIPAITSAAGVSNQTFYEHFSCKRDAFFGALDSLASRALPRIAEAIAEQESWSDGIAAGLAALLAYLSENPRFARLAFIETLSTGTAARDRAETMMDGFTSLFYPGAVPADVRASLPEVVLEATAGGIWSVLQYETAHGRVSALPELLPEIAFIAFAPLGAELSRTSAV